MGKIFSVYASQGPNNYVELDLPASDYEMLDLKERLRLEPGQLPYVEILKFNEEYGYLEKCIPELPDIFQLNALAKKMSEFSSVQDKAAFEGLVGKEMAKGTASVELPQLIDIAHSTDCCHVVEDVVTDYELGRFLAENGFVLEAEDLSDAAFELLDFSKIGREHRETEGSVFTSLGYVEQYMEVHHVSETMDFQPQKPEYTILLSMRPLPFSNENAPKDNILMSLPASEEQMRDALEKMDVNDWNDVAASIWDCVLPQLFQEIYLDGEVPQIAEFAQCLSTLDARDELPQYKALLAAMECRDIGQAITLAGTVDEYIFNPKAGSPEDVAMSELRVMIDRSQADSFAQYVNLQAFGLSLLERDHAVITSYGLIERQDGQPIQAMEQNPEGMVMM